MLKLYLCLKRAFDVIAGLIAILLLLPLWITVAIAIKCDSKGPVLFCQERLTKGGRCFKMYKFRSMVVNAEHMGAGLFNYANDPRVTRLGRFLRSSSIDELPQLINVIKGDLSLVGPRPPVSYELGDFETLNEKYKKRFSMRGGITGLAQIKGRNDISWEEKVTYDNQYINLFKKYGIWLDLWIILCTIARVLKRADICEAKPDDTMSDHEAARLAEEDIIRRAHTPNNKCCNGSWENERGSCE